MRQALQSLRITAAIAALGASLAACGGIRVASEHQTTPAAAPVPDQTTAVRSTEPRTVVVQRGETLYGIARNNNVPVRGLIRLNGLQPPYRLQVGDTLRLPPASAVHTVVSGETLYGISRRYRVDMARLARENELDPSQPILLGQQLIIPEAVATAVAAAPDMPRQPGAALPSDMTVESEPLPPLPSQPQVLAAPPAQPPTPAREEPDEKQASLPPQAPATARRGSAFLKPVDGPILSAYGAKTGGLHNDGINIAAPRGTAVLAARDGVVAYAGNELPGFGNLVLVKHDDGWITAYGHNDTIMVKKGAAVKRGQPIARVGSSGNVSRPQLHFELRQGSRAVDPAPYLAGEEPRTSAVGGRGQG